MYGNTRVTTISQRWLNHGFTIFFCAKNVKKLMKRETNSVNVKWFSETTIYFSTADRYDSNNKKTQDAVAVGMA